ncbi:MAG: hypothetical protein U0326_06135 [Polyangiales bacterium]
MQTRLIAFLLAFAAPTLAWSQVAPPPPPPPPSQPVAPWATVPPPPPPDATPPQYAPQQPQFAPQQPPQYAPQQPQYAPQVQGVPVRFTPALTDDDFTVTVMSAAGEQRCHAPCSLPLPPGPVHVSVRGEASYEQDVFIPPQPTMIRIRRFRAGRLVWALSGLGAGLAFSIAGMAISSNASSCYSSSCDSDSSTGTMMLLLGSALAVTAATTGFSTMGGNRLDVAPDYGLYARARGPRFAGFGLSPLREGGASAGAAITF